ncbi:MAG: acyl-protein synthetase, partial [Bacillota bacterium]
RVFDYYGMAEQTGTIYMECEHGHLHTPVWSDVLIRRPLDFSMANIGEPGLIEVVSALPGSYPGHALLTEDEGRVLGEDDCPCGRLGKYIEVLGRIKRAEARGCSDTYEQP